MVELYDDQEECIKKRQEINLDGSYNDICALQSYNLFVPQPQQQGEKSVHAYGRHRHQRR